MKILKIVLLTVNLLLLFESYSLAQSCSVTRLGLKNKLIQSMSSPPGLQDFIFGPLTDGRRLRIQFEYVATRKGTGVVAGSNPQCVSVDRVDFARSNMILDAFSECARISRCDLLPKYVDRIFRLKTVSEMDFFEVLDADVSIRMKDWCLNKQYANQWFRQIGQMTLALQLHEISHIALRHVAPTTATQEAEADGFSAAIAEMVNIPMTAGGAFLAQRVEAQRNFEDTSASHPPSECRVEALVLGLSAWYSQRPQLRPPQTRFRDTKSNFGRKVFSEFLPRNKNLCDRYAQDYHKGVLQGYALVTKQSGFTFLFEGFGRRCTVNSSETND